MKRGLSIISKGVNFAKTLIAVSAILLGSGRAMAGGMNELFSLGSELMAIETIGSFADSALESAALNEGGSGFLSSLNDSLCVNASCALAGAWAAITCNRDPTSEYEAELRRLSQSNQGDVRRTCEATAQVATRGAQASRQFASECGRRVLIAAWACRRNIINCEVCAANPTTATVGGACLASIGLKVGVVLALGNKAVQSNRQAKEFKRTAEAARRCEADVRSRNQCTTFADFESKPECRFELCPNMSSSQGLTSEQVQQRLFQALESFRSRGASYTLTDADRGRICSAAAMNCQNPEFRNDPVCRCEREPTGSGCRNVASVTTTTRPGDGGGSPTNGGPPTGGGSPTGGGPNNTLPGSFTNGDGLPTGEGPGFNDGRGNGSNNNGLRLNVGNGSGGSGTGGGAGGGGSGSSALGGGGAPGGGMSEGGPGGSTTGATGSQAAAASEGAGFSAGAFGDGAEGGGGGGSASRSFNPNMAFGGAGGYRKPGAAGLSVNHGQDRIGVSGENMFLMIERQYKRQRSLGTLLPDGP